MYKTNLLHFNNDDPGANVPLFVRRNAATRSFHEPRQVIALRPSSCRVTSSGGACY